MYPRTEGVERMKWETENDYVNDAVWTIIDYIDDKAAFTHTELRQKRGDE